MSSRICSSLLILCLAGTVALSAEKKASGIITVNRAPVPATQKPDPDLTTYYVGLITKGANFDAYDLDDKGRIQAAHMRNLALLAQEGKLLVSGPISDNAEWRGLFIFKCANLAEAEALAAADPAVLAGRFKIEVHPWLTEKGAIRDPEFTKK